MTLDSRVEAELMRHPWSNLREIGGTARHVPDALRRMLSAQDAATVEEAYWHLENHVVVQGQLFQAAEATTHVLVAALSASKLPAPVKFGILELLLQIVLGESHPREEALGVPDLGPRCRDIARQALDSLRSETGTNLEAAAQEVIQVLLPKIPQQPDPG